MFWHKRMERDLEQDIEEHIAIETEENIGRGMSPEEARYAALRKFGNIALVKEDTRSVWIWTWLEALAADVRHGLRRMRRSPGTTALVILSLSIAFIPSVTLFSVLDRLFLTSLPIRNPEEIVEVLFRNVSPKAEQRFESVSYAEVQDFAHSLKSISGIAFRRGLGAVVVLNGRRATLWGALVNREYFDVLGIGVQFGPGFATDLRPVIISHSLWTREFGARPDIVGQSVLVNGNSLVICGVAEPGFRGTVLHIPADFWIPVDTLMELQPDARGMLLNRDRRDGTLWARLRPGVSPAAAAAEVDSLGRSLAQRWPESNRDLKGFVYNPLADRARMGIAVSTAGVLLLGILLAVASANVTGVVLARAEERRMETAVRQALGASRFRLIREWMVESAILSLCAAALGLAGASFLVGRLPGLPLPIPVHFDFVLGPRVWLYAAVMAVVAALSFGLVPAWRGSRQDLLTGLRRDATVGFFRARIPIRSLLVITQVAAAEFLLFGAGLVLERLWTLRHTDPGFDPNRPVAMAMLLPSSEDGGSRQADCEAISTQLIEMSGVRRVAYGRIVPLSGSMGPTLRLELPGQEPRQVLGGSVGPGYFSLLGMRMRAGRDLNTTDEHGALVNPALARLVDPTGSVIGRQIRIDGQVVEIAGVFEDTSWNMRGEASRPRVVRLLPPRSGGDITFAVEVAGDPRDYVARLRTELTSALPGGIVLTSKTLAQHYDESLFLERLASTLLYVVGLLALVLTATGLHGITTALFVRRTKEFAIRLAIGASPNQIVRAVIGSSLRLAGIGLLLGLAIAFPAALLLRANVSGFVPWSVAALGFSSAIVIAAALAAASQPARRVLRLQPSDALRAE